MRMHLFIYTFVFLAVISQTSWAEASRGPSRNEGHIEERSVRHNSDDDGTPDQGRGDVSVSPSVGFTNSSDDDGTRDQGRGDFDARGNAIISSEDDDGTPDQGRGDFFEDESGLLNDSTDDDGTLDQGRGDFDASGNILSGVGDDDGTQDQGRGDKSVQAVAQFFEEWFRATFRWFF